MRTVPDVPQTTAPTAGGRTRQFFRGAGIDIGLTILSGVLAALLFVPFDCWWLAWVALVPLLLALRRTPTVRGAGRLMLLFGVIFFAVAVSWLGHIFSTGAIGIYVIAALPWILFGVTYRATVALAPARAVVLLAPVLFLAAEWIRCEGWYFQFSWGQLGFAFTAAPGGNLLYPYIGVYGVTFLIVLVNAAIAEILMLNAAWSRKRLLLLYVSLLPLILTIIFVSRFFSVSSLYGDLNGGLGVYYPPDYGGLRAAIVQDESSQMATVRQLTLPFKGKLLEPALIVWPEYAITDNTLDHPDIQKELVDTAREMHATLVVGGKLKAPADTPVDPLRRRAMMSTDGELFYNTAMVISPEGKVLGTYYKTHPIQFFSDGVPGRRYPVINTPAGKVGIGICYDFDYASTALCLVQNGAQILAVPTYDSMEWGDTQHTQHARMAQARAAEVYRWVARATTSGVSQIINPCGYVMASIPNGQSSVITDEAGQQSELTPYVLLTHWLPQACLLIGGLWSLWLLLAWGAGILLARRHTVH